MILTGFLCINVSSVTKYERKQYEDCVQQNGLFATSLCTENENVFLEDFEATNKIRAGALFEIEGQNIYYAKDIHKRIYPASLTKLLTIHLALEYGDLSDVVTVSKNATSIPSDSSSANLKTGDRLTLKDLLYGLMLPSGNDCAVAIAEHISGNEESFVSLMNEEANKIGATHTHFVNSHGYHDEEHYTTTYDLYLIFNQCISEPEFLKIISTDTYQAKISQANGKRRDVIWKQSNQYLNGLQEPPEHVMILGGKTGTTNAAKACLILYCKDQNLTPYISIIMGAETRTALYANMTALISTIPEE